MSDHPLEIACPGPVRPPAAAIPAGARRREEQGFAAMWWADHLLHWFPESIWTPDLVPQAATQPSPHVWIDPFPAVAAAAAATERLRFGIGVTDLVRRHPAQLAQTAMTLDHLTGGRFILGVGTGEAINLTPFGLENPRPMARLEEGLAVIRLLYSTDEPVSFSGDHFRLERATLGLRPVAGDPPPLWLAAHRPRGLRLVGQLADGWIPLATTVEEYRTNLATLRGHAERAGRGTDAVTPGLYVRVVLAADRAQARAALDRSLLMRFIALTRPADRFAAFGAEHPIGPHLEGIGRFLPTEYGRDGALALARSVPEEVVADSVMHGTADEVAAELRPFLEAGARHVQLVNMSPLADPALAGESEQQLQRLAALLRA